MKTFTMSKKRPLLEIGMASLFPELQCAAHGHTGNLPCPWPECPNGLDHEGFDTQLYGIPSIRQHYARRQWASVDGGVRFCWDDPENPAWLLANKLAWEEICRLIPSHASAPSFTTTPIPRVCLG